MRKLVNITHPLLPILDERRSALMYPPYIFRMDMMNMWKMNNGQESRLQVPGPRHPSTAALPSLRKGSNCVEVILTFHLDRTEPKILKSILLELISPF